MRISVRPNVITACAKAVARRRWQPHTSGREPPRFRTCGNSMHWALLGSIAILLGSIPPGRAAEADNGKRLAQQRCAPCHAVVASPQRSEVADSPPFETIARKFDYNAGVLALSLHDPHPRMNMPLTRAEAEDIAAYVVTLGH